MINKVLILLIIILNFIFLINCDESVTSDNNIYKNTGINGYWLEVKRISFEESIFDSIPLDTFIAPHLDSAIMSWEFIDTINICNRYNKTDNGNYEFLHGTFESNDSIIDISNIFKKTMRIVDFNKDVKLTYQFKSDTLILKYNYDNGSLGVSEITSYCVPYNLPFPYSWMK